MADKKARQKKYESIDLYSNPVKLSSRKGYELSTINTGYGAEQGLYEIGARKDGDFVELPALQSLVIV